VIEGGVQPAAPRRMARVAVVAARSVSRTLTGSRCAVMTGVAAAGNIKMVDVRVQPAAAGIVTGLAGIGGRDMSRSLARSC
jgi:hypothetical protein